MHALKWWKESTRMFFDGGAPGSSAGPSLSDGGPSGGAVPSTGPDGGGSSTPPTPPSPDSSAAPTPATPDANPWEALGSMDDLDHVEIPPTPQTPPAPAPVVPPAATPPVASTAPVPPVAAAPAPAQADPQAPPAAQLSPSDPVGIAAAIEANRNDVIAHLATTKFALTPEDITELETDVVAAVPKIMARVYTESQMAMQRFLAQALPGMLNKHNTVTKANDDAETKFFDTHKAAGLDKSNPQHRAVAVRLATLYRQANPNIPLEQLIQEIGPMVAKAVGAQAGPPQQQIPVTPGTPRMAAPFRPAVNGGGGAPPTPVEENPWAGLGATYD